MNRLFAWTLTAVAGLNAAAAAELSVVATSPARHDVAPSGTSIGIVFDRPVHPLTIDSSTFRVFGRASGPVSGIYSFSQGARVVTLTPDTPFQHGEVVRVNLSRLVRASDMTPLRSAGYAYEFSIGAKPAARAFTMIDMMTVEDGGPNPRVYGAQASDLDGDGFTDLAAVNEDSSDIRVFLNRADGTGLFHDFLTPPEPVGSTPSPNEPADFDNDGFIDICTANTGGASVSIVLGDGDGTFGPHQPVAVGSGPHGLAVLDMDGDADHDVATANTGGDNVSIALNNGAGVFGLSSSFDGGGSGEYALASGDMNNDGIYDLVVGTRYDERIVVHRGNGNGTFTAMPVQDAGGLVWMVSLGDVDGDGHLDVSTANSQSNSGSILLGGGDGTLGPPALTAMSAHVPATDLGDWDGDGDLDWVLSSFGGGHWRLFVNDGQGNFAFDQEFDAPSNPSCAIPVDFDNDRDLDLVLTDEISNDILLMQNSAIAGDDDGDGVANAQDCAPSDGQAWSLPGEVRDLRLHHAGGVTLLSWSAAAPLGGAAPGYDVLRSAQASAFSNGSPTVVCIESGDAADSLAHDDSTPGPIFFYLARAANSCGEGTAGVDSAGTPHDVGSCP